MKTWVAAAVCLLGLADPASAQGRLAMLADFSTFSVKGLGGGGSQGAIKNTPCHHSSGPNECKIIVRARLSAIDEDDGDDDDSAVCEIRVPTSVIIPPGYAVTWRLSKKSFDPKPLGKGFKFSGAGIIIDSSGVFGTPSVSANWREVTATPVAGAITTVSSYTVLLEVDRSTTAPPRIFKCAGLDPIIVNRN